MKRVWVLSLTFLFFFAAIPIWAADFPDHAITYSIPFDPGGLSDLTARYQQTRLEKILGVDIVMQYKPGGGGSVGWTELTKKKSDGYFMSGINIPHIVLQPLAREDAGYKTEELLPICIFQDTPIGLAVLKDSQFKTLDDFLKFAKEKPGMITVAGSGTWTGDHITHLMAKETFDINISYVPFTGGAKATAAFLGGHVMAFWMSSSEAVQHTEKIRLLAVAANDRLEHYPEAPTFKDLGYDLESGIARGVAVPPGTPKDRVKILENAFRKLYEDPEVRDHFADEGYVNIFLGSEEATEYIQNRVKVMKPLVEKYKN